MTDTTPTPTPANPVPTAAAPTPAAPAATPASPPAAKPATAAPADANTILLTKALKAVLPHVDTAKWVPALIAGFTRFDMLAPRRMAAAIGQFSVEAGNAFHEIVENLNYSTATRIHAVFPGKCPTVASAQPFVHNPQALANHVYANRPSLGNGDEASGDGWRFRGRGLIQLTGRNEYTEFATAIGKTPQDASDLCETPEGAALSGCWYLSSRHCLTMADGWHLDDATRAVNGRAMLGAAERAATANAMLAALGGK